jgi:hypothetical protein
MSSFRIVPAAVAIPSVAPTGLESVMVKLSSFSTVVSPRTLIVIVRLSSPAAKDTVPPGSKPPKSVPLAGLTPLPATAYTTPAVPLVLPLRVTVKANGVVPELPSARSAPKGFAV